MPYQPDQTLLQTGLRLLAAGYSLLPTNQRKQPNGAALIATNFTDQIDNERPKAAWRQLQEHPPTRDELREWLTFPGCGLGIVTGQISGIIALDADGEAGLSLFEKWNAAPHTRSRSGGLHWYLSHPGWRVPTLQSKTNARLADIRGIDIRADGGYIIIPPTSIQGKPYTALRDPLTPSSADALPPAVSALLGLAGPPSPPQEQTVTTGRTFTTTSLLDPSRRWRGADGTPLETELLSRALTNAHDGQGRENCGFELACQLRDNRYDYTDAQQIMRQYQDQVPDTDTKGQLSPYTLQEALHSLQSAYRGPARAPWEKRREKPPTLLDELKNAWPSRNASERQQLARCLLGSRNPQAAQWLAELNYDPTQDLAHIAQLRAKNRLIPGLTTLRKLLNKG